MLGLPNMDLDGTIPLDATDTETFFEEFEDRQVLKESPESKQVDPPKKPRRNLASRLKLRNRPVRRFLKVTHRWSALTLGLLLLLITVSGSVILYQAEYHELRNSSLYEGANKPVKVTPVAALAAAENAYPKKEFTSISFARGIYMAESSKDHKTAFINPTNGQVNGVSNPHSGLMGALDNLHMCFLGCEDYPLHISLLGKEIKVLGNEITWGSVGLGILAALLMFFGLSGIVLWWPGLKKALSTLKVRRKNRYSINYDLHKLVGLAAIPFLLMWGFTGFHWTLEKQVKSAWFAVLPGGPGSEPVALVSNKPKQSNPAPITVKQAIAAAQKRVPDLKFAGAWLPEKGDKKAPYDIWFSSRNDPYDHSAYAGNVQVWVDKYDRQRTKIGWGDPRIDRPVSASLYESWFFPIHAGTPVNEWWRLLWLLFGLAPLLLAVTGTATWLLRRRMKKQKRKKQKLKRAASAATA